MSAAAVTQGGATPLKAPFPWFSGKRNKRTWLVVLGVDMVREGSVLQEAMAQCDRELAALRSLAPEIVYSSRAIDLAMAELDWLAERLLIESRADTPQRPAPRR